MFYQKRLSAVSVITDQGPRLQFPFHHLRPFISHIGVKGRFRVILDEANVLALFHLRVGECFHAAK